MREEAAGGEGPVAEWAPSVVGVGPLRGDKPSEPSVEEPNHRSGTGAAAGGRPKAVGGGKAQQRRRVGLPADLGLRVALGPVAWLWERLNGWQQDQVKAATKVELTWLAGMLMRPETAPKLLAERLAERLRESGGEALIGSPYGWIIHRGLVQRPACSDRRCDDGVRLDTGAGCESCRNVIHVRRAWRMSIAAQVHRERPGLGDEERQRVLEARLREQAAVEAQDFEWRREQAAAKQARRDAARAAAQEQAVVERQAAATADAVRQALPCEDCGLEAAAGLCEACGHRRATENLIWQAGLFAATWSADPTDGAAIEVAAADARTGIEREIARTWQQFLQITNPADLAVDPVTARITKAFSAFQTAQQEAGEYERYALSRLGQNEDAEAEARRAYQVDQNRPWFRAIPNSADAVAAATQAADSARERTAQHLLTVRLEQLRTQASPGAGTRGKAPWTVRLAGLADRPLDGDTARVVIA
ncbi:hypothetical protein [Streptomyces niveus]|uniref:hypothetical protein n=1 Tax=Streptomyces niveus TaxID=193462 RepID=UPI0036392152